MEKLNHAIQTMTNRIVGILRDCEPSVYLHGSLVLGDFRFGWSDIDILVLTGRSMSNVQAEHLVNLRQELLSEEPGNPYYRSFEGGMLSLDGFLHHTPDTVVYWGTSGQRVTDRYEFNSLCMLGLLEKGRLLCGSDVREKLKAPTCDELKRDVRAHHKTIRRYAGNTERSLYSFGWLLDISRCLYTLKTGEIISKTVAAEWALKEKLCPVAAELERALEVRRKPHIYICKDGVLAYAESLGPAIQRYADVLGLMLEESVCMK